ncbi:MAG: 16S rRNA (uracil(1498)-N(3))-methyltransferase [Alphaproteobacteria bacterium]|nr:MAG: 16S rRNA (uracil(1498)-N(3))-methyltransferase [Alphaproteobacteria bacterium]
MARYDFRSPRLFVDAAFAPGAVVALAPNQTNYLRNVLRLKPGAPVLVFNGRDGEWRAELRAVGKKGAELSTVERVREQTGPEDLHYLFSPLKHARLDYMVQKAVEMGASRLQPVIMRHTQAERVNLDRMRANAIEAAEQCGILAIAEIAAPKPFDSLTRGWKADRLLVFCDEEADVKDPVAALATARSGGIAGRPPVSVLIGPEGGFAENERAALLKLPNVVRLGLGPRILRADTAAVAALTLVQSVLGDWR